MAISRASDSSIQDGLPKYNDIWDGITATSAFDVISHVTLGAAQSTIEFNNIPATYTHLQIRWSCSVNRTTYAFDDLKLNLNSDTSVNYSRHFLRGDGSTASAGADTALAYICLDAAAGTNVSNFFGVGILDLLDYSNTNKYKTTRALTGTDTNGLVAGIGGRVDFQSGNWRNTNAVTSITFAPVTGTLFNQYSSFALYGIK